MSATHRARMSQGVRNFILELNEYPGWKRWVERRIAHTLYFDDASSPSAELEDEFVLSPEMETRHAVIYQYLGLQQTIHTLRECEYYFRRYPFHGLPVTRDSHFTNVCEMYFGRFYEFRERLKNYLEAVKAEAPGDGGDFGRYIRAFDSEFDSELRVRHGVHHRGRFSDVAIERIYMSEVMLGDPKIKYARLAQQHHYRKLTKEWVGHVRRGATRLESVLERIAQLTLERCQFLSANPKPRQ